MFPKNPFLQVCGTCRSLQDAIPVTHAMHIATEVPDPFPHWVHEAIAAEHGAQSFLISAFTTKELRGGQKNYF